MKARRRYTVEQAKYEGGFMTGIRLRFHFTLIELLIVIAILAILAGLLLPALNTARKKAHSISCLSNMKQLYIAWMSYAGDNSEYIIPYYTDTGTAIGEYSGTFPWFEQFMVHEYIPGIAGDTNAARAKAARKLFICPSDENPNFFYQNFKVFISYGYNRYMTKKKEFSDLSLPAHPMDRLSVKNPYPDKTHVLADNWGREATKNNSLSLIALNFVDEYSFNINAVHATGMNSVFLDGHAALAVMSYWNPFTCANDLWNLSDSAALTPIYTTKP